MAYRRNLLLYLRTRLRESFQKERLFDKFVLWKLRHKTFVILSFLGAAACLAPGRWHEEQKARN